MRAKLICGDAQNAITQLPEQSIDCIVTSPPYFHQRDYHTGYWIGGDVNCDHRKKSTRNDLRNHKPGIFGGWSQGAPHYDYIMYNKQCKKCGAVRVDQQIGMEGTLNEYIERLVSVFDSVRHVLKKQGTMFIVLGDTYYYKTKTDNSNFFDEKTGIHLQYKEGCLMLIPYLLALTLIERGWYIRQLIVWHKPNALPEPFHKRFKNDYEIIIFATQNRDYFFDKTQATEISVHTARPRLARSVWSVPVGQAPGTHSAVMPIAVAEKCILTGCPPEGTVLDPFCGSGTVLITALKNNRHAIGIDLSQKYIEIAAQRIQKETGIYPEVHHNEKEEKL